jgi:hypothetical protein
VLKAGIPPLRAHRNNDRPFNPDRVEHGPGPADPDFYSHRPIIVTEYSEYFKRFDIVGTKVWGSMRRLLLSLMFRGKTPQFCPQQLPGPAQVGGGPAAPQHLSAAFSGNLLVGLTAAWADKSFLRFRLPQFPQTTRSVSLFAIKISK